MKIEDKALEPYFIKIDKYGSHNIYKRTDKKPFERSIMSKANLLDALHSIVLEKIGQSEESLTLAKYCQEILPMKETILELGNDNDLRIKKLQLDVEELKRNAGRVDLTLKSVPRKKSKKKPYVGGVIQQMQNNPVFEIEATLDLEDLIL